MVRGTLAVSVALALLSVACHRSGGASVCRDGERGPEETDIDCGGVCAPCGDGLACLQGSDCLSGACLDGRCLAPGCENGIQDGDESDVDCGGTCSPCAAGARCDEDDTCASGRCGADGVCLAPSCEDGRANGDESDVDCGGACPPCALAQACNAPSDCGSGVCAGGLCRPPACENGHQDGDESDVDCGGATCGRCGANRNCREDTDCSSGVCLASRCVADACADGQRDLDETDVDCGGGRCPGCAGGLACQTNDDCQLGLACRAGACTSPCAGVLCSGIGSCQVVARTALCICPAGSLDDGAGGCARSEGAVFLSLVGSTSRFWYLRGFSDPPSTWTQPDATLSSEWIEGQGDLAIGYGDARVRTELADMRGAYLSVYVRIPFRVGSELGAVTRLLLSVAYDDGYAAYLNGREIGRFGLPSGPLHSQTPATLKRVEAANAVFDVDPALLVEGINLLAFELHNASQTSSDAWLVPRLYALSGATLPSTPDSDGDGLEDLLEDLWGSDPAWPDSDDDGLTDGEELGADGDPSRRDPTLETNPFEADTDGDGVGDGAEAIYGTSPLDATDHLTWDAVLGQGDGLGTARTNVQSDTGARNDVGAHGFDSPRELTVEGGQLFVSDRSNHRVLVFDLDASADPTSHAAAYVLGQTDTEHNEANRGGDPDRSTLNRPRGIDVVQDGATRWLVVADSGNHRVLVYDLGSGLANGLAADVVLGQTDFSGDRPNRGAGTSGCTPAGVGADTLVSPTVPLVATVGTRTLLFVADTGNNRVLGWDLSAGGLGSLGSGAPADYVLGQPDLQTRSSNACGSTAADTLDDPDGLALWGTILFVSDQYNDRVLGFDLGPNASRLTATPSGLAASWVLGQATFDASRSNQGGAAGPATLYAPGALGLDGDRLIVADRRNHRVMVYDLSAGLTSGMNAAFVFGQPDFVSTTAATSATGLSWPRGLGVAEGQRLFVGDALNHRVLTFDLVNLPSAIASGSYGPPALGVLGQTDALPGATSATPLFDAGRPNDLGPTGLETPSAVTLASVMGQAILFVIDSGNHRILGHTLAADGLPDDLVPDLALGGVDLDHRKGGSSASLLDSPSDVALDPATGNLFVADTQNHRVLVFDTSAGLRSGQAAIAVLGQPDLTSNAPNAGGALGPAALVRPRSVLVLSLASGRYLAVSDSGNGRVLFFDLSDGLSTGEAAAEALGRPDFVTPRGLDARRTNLLEPRGLAFDADQQRLFVADYGASRVVIYDLSAGLVRGAPGDALLGQPVWTEAAAGTDRSSLRAPSGVAFDPIGTELWVADTGNHRVLRFSLPPGFTGPTPADLVLGQASFADARVVRGTKRSERTLYKPRSVALDATRRRLWIADQSNHRILALPLP